VKRLEKFTQGKRKTAISQDFDLKAELKKCKTTDSPTGKNGLLQRLAGGMLEQLLQNEVDESLVKMLFLVVRDVSKKWTMPVHGWKTIVSHLPIAYGDRLGFDT